MAKERTETVQIVRDDLQKLEKELKKNLKLNDIHYDCAWNVEHLRGCLKSLVHLHKMHTDEFKCLEGKWQLDEYLGKYLNRFILQVEQLYLLAFPVLAWMDISYCQLRMCNIIG